MAHFWVLVPLALAAADPGRPGFRTRVAVVAGAMTAALNLRLASFLMHGIRIKLRCDCLVTSVVSWEIVALCNVDAGSSRNPKTARQPGRLSFSAGHWQVKYRCRQGHCAGTHFSKLHHPRLLSLPTPRHFGTSIRDPS